MRKRAYLCPALIACLLAGCSSASGSTAQAGAAETAAAAILQNLMPVLPRKI